MPLHTASFITTIKSNLTSVLLLLLLGWLCWFSLVIDTFTLFPTGVLAGVVFLALFYTIVSSPDRWTALIGKVVVVASVVLLVSQFITSGSLSVDIVALQWLVALLSGLWLERISPHQQFYTWMFLAIATKVEFVLVSAFITYMGATAEALLVPTQFWWLLVGMMALTVPVAIVQQGKWYRICVWATSICGVALFSSLVLSSVGSLGSLGIAFAATAWPMLADRWVGKRLFVK